MNYYSKELGNFTKISALLFIFFFITALSSFTTKEIIKDSCQAETLVITTPCVVNFTLGDPCVLCITCTDAGQRILVESTGSSGYIFPVATVPLCFDVAIGRSVQLTQYGCGPSGIDLGEHECL